jgi:transposase
MAYSTDLREKIVRAYDEGLGSQRAIAELFGVSRSFVEKLLARRRATGEIAPLPHGGGRQSHCDARDIALVQQHIKEQPDATLSEVCHRVHQEHSTSVSYSAMSRLLKRLGLPRKKSRSTPVSETLSVSKRRVKRIAK